MNGGIGMKIIYDSMFKRNKKKLEQKHMQEEIDNLFTITTSIVSSNNLYDLLNSNIAHYFHIEFKTSDMKMLLTARLNRKIRLIMQPIGKYPYNTLEIIEIEFVKIDNHHYGDS